MDCSPPNLCECGAAVVAEAIDPIRHQVFDIPAIKANVVEYRRYAGCCMGCGKAVRGALPNGVPSGQIGPRALALVGTLGTHFQLTQMKVRDLMARLLGVDFSVGAISQAHGKVAQALAVPISEMGRFVKQEPVKHMDETRFPREGAGNWVWAVVTTKVAWYNMLPSRARYVAINLVGEDFTGILVSDRYAVYDFVSSDQRQVCWAHLIRDFRRIADRQGLAGQIGRGLLATGHLVFRWRKKEKSKAQFEPLQRRVHRLLTQGSEQLQCKRTAKTCENLLKLWPALWTYLDNAAVPPTNNDAERALRALVLKRKISGPTRSKRGDELLARGFSAYETGRKQGRDLWSFMQEATVAWLQNAAAPSLVPRAAAAGAPSG